MHVRVCGKVNVRVDEAGEDGLIGKVYPACFGRRRQVRSVAHRGDASIFDNQRLIGAHPRLDHVNDGTRMDVGDLGSKGALRGQQNQCEERSAAPCLDILIHV